ncbi:MAG: hypothetical protein H0T79_02970 [Deltaproteobacteria bacterium]|nr:hypothetical protein [Deltaproteobacteria bacterium]
MNGASSAYAEDQTFHLTLTTDVSATDNVFGVPSDGPTEKEFDLYAQIRPGLLYNYLTPRSTYEAFAEMEILEYIRHSDQPSVTARGGGRSSFVTGPFSNITFAANGSTGKLAAIGVRSSPDQTEAQITPPGQVDIIQADASHGGSWQAGRTYRFFESLSARWSQAQPINDSATTESSEFGAGLGFEKSFEDNSFGIDVGVAYLRLLNVQFANPDAMTPLVGRLDRQLNPRIGMSWRHDITRNWSTGLSGGLVYVIPLWDDPYKDTNPMFLQRGRTVSPVVGGQVSYTDVWGYANLSVSRTVSPAVLIAQNTINDGVAVTVGMPLTFMEDSRGRAPRWLGLGSAGVQRTQLINASGGSPEGTFGALRIDLGVTYAVRPGMTLGGRYSIQHQTGDAEAVMAVASYTTNTLTFTMTMRYPERTAVRQKRNKRKHSTRADRSDVTPLEEMSPSDGGDAPIPDGYE